MTPFSAFIIYLAPLATPQSVLSPFEILKIVGFATGAALHLYLFWMLYQRYGIRRAERSFLGLGLSIGLWHLGNFAAAIYELIDVSGGLWWLKLSNVIAYSALAFLPPFLAHAHFRVWDWFDESAPRRFFRPAIAIGYVPLLILPWAIDKLWSDPYQPPTEKLSALLLPFILWIVFIFLECAFIDWRLAGRLQAARERRFFEVFGISLAIIGALFLITYVFEARQWGITGSYLDLIARLSSLAPTMIVAYYIYRYRYLELVIRQSLVYAALAALVMMVYVYGIRRLSIELNARYGVRPEAIEALLILVVMFLAGPLRRASDTYLRRLFTREVGLYRDLVAQVGAEASNFGEIAHFVNFAEKRLRDSLELERIEIIAENQGEAAEARRIAEERRLTEIEDRQMLDRLDALACFPLWREGRVVGLLTVGGAPQSLTAEKREVLMVLAGHIAVAIENCQLLEEKVKLERELAERERLASLGRMAATVAHEVKNPLSAIKSITQVMREDQDVSREYGRDLDLITGEVDRLNRSVSQLLSFSRPLAVAASPASLNQIVESVVALTRGEAEENSIKITQHLESNPFLAGDLVAAVKESLLNLALNAIQANRHDGKHGGEVRIESFANGAGQLHLAVTDDGEGIPELLQEKIFEPFFTTKQRGTGLGLPIVARRVRDLGGEIKVTSPVDNGYGTRFDLKFEIGS